LYVRSAVNFVSRNATHAPQKAKRLTEALGAFHRLLQLPIMELPTRLLGALVVLPLQTLETQIHGFIIQLLTGPLRAFFFTIL